MRAKKITLALVVLLVACRLAILQAADSGSEAVSKTRQSLRDQGFKTDLADFDFTTSAELQKREAILDLSMGYVRGRKPAGWKPPPSLPSAHDRLPEVEFNPRVADDAAVVIWNQDHLASEYSETGADAWPVLRTFFGNNQSDLDEKCAAILSGPIRFNLDASTGHLMLLPHLAGIKQLGRTLGTRVMLAFHDGNPDAAWTNLLAATRLAIAWEPEPLEISHSVRFGCASISAQTTWQALQTNAWNDERLAQLQAEWESVNYFKNLPETAAYARACAVATCQFERADRSAMPSMNDLVREPKSTVDAYMQNRRYSHSGSYEDEKSLLLHYRDREVELRNAVKCTTWLQMRQLPGVTNLARFNSTNSSRTLAMMNLRAVSIGLQLGGAGFVGRAAEAEALRRVVITALALERFHIRHGAYPKSLAELSPGLLPQPLADFIDGKPLRYRLTNDGRHFVLYSVGLDGADDGGTMPQPERWNSRRIDLGESATPAARKQSDIVWPRPASLEEAAEFKRQEKATADAIDAEMERRQIEARWNYSEQRQARAADLLAKNPPGVTNVAYHGRPLANLLRNRNSSKTNKLSLAEMLTLRRVMTDDEPETITFEASVAFDSLAKFGELMLLVDPIDEPDFPGGGCAAVVAEVKRATNGNCLIAWNTVYECSGTHAVRLWLEPKDPDEFTGDVYGPFLSVAVSNLCQFGVDSVNYDSATGALFHARLPEQNGSCVIEMSDTNGVHLRTITGTTTNGVIKEMWDLVDERGARFTNGVFNCLFNLALPESGRRQKLRL